MEKETRTFKMEVRAAEEDGGTSAIAGYAAVFNRDSEDLGGFIERIKPGAFKKALKKSDVRALIDHKPELIVGRAGVNLELSEDKQGLHIRLTPPPAGSARYEQLSADIESGLITQQSFGFTVRGDQWENLDGKNGPAIRTITEIDQLFDVSAVTYPAYPDTTIAKRSMDELQSAKRGAGNTAKRRRRQIEILELTTKVKGR